MHYLELIKIQPKHKSVSVAAKVTTRFPSEMTQIDDHVRKKLISIVIKNISKVLQTLFKFSNGTVISAFIRPLLSVLAKKTC